ncbi:MAG TPA: endonuclease/exonuclease/phosphatase family protein [Streptosporangiaceae bacterium]|nr:endonuclease/exonuclease/phosphatase family protein [Streptosporangiaceae bacterium]
MAEGTSAIEAERTNPPRRGRRRRAARIAGVGLLAIGWLIVGVLGLAAVLRLVSWDSIEPFAVIDALTLVIYLPAWVVAAGALIARRWWLAAAAAVIIAAQVTFVLPELTAAAPVPAWARHAPVLRIFDVNTDDALRFYPGYVQAIEHDRPDLVTLEEFEPSAWRSMQASGVLAQFPHQCAAPQEGAIGFALVSRYPLTGCHEQTVDFDGWRVPYMVDATLWTPSGPVTLRLVHTLAPLPSSFQEWKAALAAVDRSVSAGSTSRMLMIGDFNASWDSKGFAALLHDGLTDGAAARGDATEMTWPNGAIVPPFVRIDHVLTGSRLAVTGIIAKPGFGTDHRYVVATVAIQKAPR